MLKTIRTLIPAFALLICTSCEDNQIIPEEENYFPLESHSQWDYQRWWIWPQTEKTIMDTIQLRVSGDTLVDGLSYKIIAGEDGIIDKLIRRDNSKYYGRHHEFYGSFSKEYLFLDTSLPVGGSWTHIKDDGYVTKTEYIIKAKDSGRNIGGKTYSDVIEVEVNYYYKELDEEKL